MEKSTELNTGNKLIRIAGALFLLQLTAALISFNFIVEPILWEDKFLAKIASQPEVVKFAAFCDLFCGVCIFGIAVLYSTRWLLSASSKNEIPVVSKGLL